MTDTGLSNSGGSSGAVNSGNNTGNQIDETKKLEEEKARKVEEARKAEAEKAKQEEERLKKAEAAAVQFAVQEAKFVASDPGQLLDELDRIQKSGAVGLKDAAAATLFAQLVNMAGELERAGAPKSAFRRAILAGNMLASKEVDISAAQEIANKLQRELTTEAPYSVAVNGMILSFCIVLGVAVLIGLIYVFGFALSNNGNWVDGINTVWDGMSGNIMLISGLFGLLGAMVSVLSSLSSLEGKLRSRGYFYLAGSVLPIVGAVFAMVVCAIFASGIITSSLVPDPDSLASLYFYAALGFISGFSERFARGLLDTFENKAGKDDNGDDAAEGKKGGKDKSGTTTGAGQ